MALSILVLVLFVISWRKKRMFPNRSQKTERREEMKLY